MFSCYSNGSYDLIFSSTPFYFFVFDVDQDDD